MSKGPRTLIWDGKQTAAFTLNRREVEELFEENFYNLNRSTWRTAMKRWVEYGVLINEVAFDQTYMGNWSIIFTNIDRENFKWLQMYSNDHECFYLPDMAEGASA